MSLTPEWLWKSFCFPCVQRTKVLSAALEASKKALATRQAAINTVRESISERHTEPAIN